MRPRCPNQLGKPEGNYHENFEGKDRGSLQPERPDMKVMLISGYADDIEIRNPDGFALLQKPFSPTILLQQIVKLLGGEIGCPLCKKTATQFDAVTYYCIDCDHEWKRHANGSGDGFVRRTAH